MATVTIPISSGANPTYGGFIQFDGVSYTRTTLESANPQVSSDGSKINRTFAFFDLSTDPTGGGTITKVELLATVASVSGTHAVDIVGGGLGDWDGDTVADGIGQSDDAIYSHSAVGLDFGLLAASTPSTGAIALDLGAAAVLIAATLIANGAGGTNAFEVGISLSNEAAAGSVVFDAAVGFGLRLTYAPATAGGKPEYDSGPMNLELPDNTALNFSSMVTTVGDVLVEWEVV